MAIKAFKESDGQVNLKNYINIIDNYQSDIIDYLYDVEPQSQNLFWAGAFCETEDKHPVKAFYNAAYRIRKVVIPMPKLEIEHHTVTRAPIFKSSNYTQEVTIDWFEDVYHSVQKYHLDWYARWYNRQYDVLRCGVSGKFRQMVLVAYHYINGNENSVIETPEIEPILSFFIGGMVPMELPDITFDHSADQNEQPISIRYKCAKILWAYGENIGMGTNSGASLWEEAGTAPTNRVWSPLTKESEYSVNGENGEAIRIIRAATSSQVSEGAL